MKSILKKVTAIVMAVTMALTVLVNTALAADLSSGDNVDVDCTYFTNAAGYYYEYDFRGQNMILPDGSPLLMFGGIPKLTVDGKVAYCIASNASAGIVDNTSSFTVSGDSITNSDLVDLALSYGYTGSTKYNETPDVERMATQIIIWCIVDGWFNNANEAKALDIYTAEMGSVASDVKTVYQSLKAKVLNHTSKAPSFCSSDEQKMNYDGNTKKWSLSLTDTNGVADKYDWDSAVSAYSNLTVSVTSSSITFTSTEKFPVRTLSASLKVDKFDSKRTVLLVSDGTGVNKQNCVTYKDNPISASLKLYAEEETGDLKIKKTSEDGKVSGISFTVKQGSSTIGTYTTNSVGEILIEDLTAGTYTVTEIAPSEYKPQDPQTVTVEVGKTAEVEFNNILKKFKVTVSKVDKEKNDAQGNASLDGAVYGIYDNGKLVDTYSTDKNGSFTTNEYVCGENWTIKEITPSEGYLLDTTTYKIGADPKLYTVEHNIAPAITSKEQVKKGKFSILKTTGNGTGLYELEVGAEFEVYLKSAGSYAKAKSYERDKLVIGDDGTATTKDLPYGQYIAHQTKARVGSQLAPDFEVFVGAENGDFKTIPVNNSRFESRIKVVKKDAETGNTIAYAGAGFQIYDPDGNLITMQITYPDNLIVDTFYTNNEGYIITPDLLLGGTGYSLQEVQAPYGYVLNTERIYFDVSQSSSSVEADTKVTIVEVVCEDAPQKGVIEISKFGEIFATVNKSEGVYQPVYEIAGLEGAVYKIIAAEDIYTLDGTLRAAEGDEVDRITTGADGIATSNPLFLGKYYVIEVTAPYGMVIDETPKAVELVYDDQFAEITLTSASFINERQTLALNLMKTMEQNELFGLGMNDEVSNVSFGLYAAADIVAADGTKIPENGLIETKFCDENGEIVFSSDLPFGTYYVRELSTDKHYILNEEQFELTFDYQGQDFDIVRITANNDTAIFNSLIYGITGGLKVSSETNEGLQYAVIGLFPADTVEFTRENAFCTVITDEAGQFMFTNVPCGEYIVREIEAPEGYDVNKTNFNAVIAADGQNVELIIKDDRLVPQIRTKIAYNFDKMDETGMFVLDDVIEYHNLIVGREYVVKGILKNINGGDNFIVLGKEVTAEAVFIPDTPDGKTIVQFVFDDSAIPEDAIIAVVAFEKVYFDGVEIAAHEDLYDKDQSIDLRPFDDLVPKGPPPSTGVPLNVWSSILAMTTLGVAIIKGRKKRGSK